MINDRQGTGLNNNQTVGREKIIHQMFSGSLIKSVWYCTALQ